MAIVVSDITELLSAGHYAPNAFILGAGKCGTTSLHAILGQHPEIHASKIKEPTFFCSYFQKVRDPIAYFRLFESPAKVRFESSHAYLSNPETVPVLKALFPDAKFIVMLRHPKNRAHSLYRHMRRHVHKDGLSYEQIPNFAAALRAEPDRYRSPEFFKTCRHYFWNFLYCRSSWYDEQLARYFSLFRREQFHIVSLAELSQYPVGVTSQILRFLQVDPAAAETFDFAIKNLEERYDPFDAEADAIMEAAFGDLTDRVDRLVGRALDWSR